MHKNPHQNAGNGIKETLFFKIFLESLPPDPPGGSSAFSVSRANSCLPPTPNFYARTPMAMTLAKLQGGPECPTYFFNFPVPSNLTCQ